jgi:cephalosporin-C deacetylase-like acetyl esterase
MPVALSTLWILLGLSLEPRETGAIKFVPGPRESTVPAQFRLEPADFSFELSPLLSAPKYSVSSLRFPSPITTPDIENNTVHAEYFAPTKTEKKYPAVVVLHILGSDFPLSRYMSARLADGGVCALFVKLPYYGERRPAAKKGQSDKRFLSTDIERSMSAMRQGILDVRRALAWLKTRPEVDVSRLGVAGISLGGIVSSIVAAVDPEVERGAFLLAGGDLSTIMWEMPEGAAYRKLWIESGRTRADLKVLTDPFDPLNHARGLIGKRIFMVGGRIDDVVPPESTLALWNAAGKPPIRWYDCGHYSAVGYLLPAIRETVAFLAAP